MNDMISMVHHDYISDSQYGSLTPPTNFPLAATDCVRRSRTMQSTLAEARRAPEALDDQPATTGNDRLLNNVISGNG